MIFIPYPMYFDPIRTMVKYNYRIYFTEGVFWPQNGSRSVKFAKVRNLEGLGPIPPIQRPQCDIFFLRVEIHRILYKIHHIAKKNIDHFAVKSVLMNPYVAVRTAPNTIHKHSIVNNHGGETLISKKPFLIYEFEYSPKVNVCLFVRIQKSLLF